MDYLHELCDIISDAISEAVSKIRSGGGKLTAGDTAYIDQLTHALKSVKAVIQMDDGYSGRYEPYRSYKRDSMGRYSRNGGMVDELRDLMHDAKDERTRQEFQRFINKIETM